MTENAEPPVVEDDDVVEPEPEGPEKETGSAGDGDPEE